MDSDYDDFYCIVTDKVRKNHNLKDSILICILNVRGKLSVFAKKYGFLFKCHRNALINPKKYHYYLNQQII